MSKFGGRQPLGPFRKDISIWQMLAIQQHSAVNEGDNAVSSSDTPEAS